MLEIAAWFGAVLLLLMLAVAVHDAVRRPGLRRLAMRNVVQRRTETVLVVLGSSLGTAIIAASFLVGATFHASVRDGARTTLGPIDEEVSVGTPAALRQVTDALSTPPMVGVDGILPTVRTTATITSRHPGLTRVVPRADVAELDLGAARTFGERPGDTGLERAGPTPHGDEALLGVDTARDLDVRVGDVVTLRAYGRTEELHVRAVLDDVGLAGATDLIVAPGTIDAMARDAPPGSEAPQRIVLVSNRGGVFDSTDRTDAVVVQIRARTAGRDDVSVATTKADLLRAAQEEGRSLGQLYTGVGSFSVIAGVLLLVNLFVMLAEDRKRELGLARAVGLSRWHLVRVFTLEGTCYAVAAAIVGAGIGTGIAWLVARATGALIKQGDHAFSLRFVVPSGVLVVAALIGMGLALVTAWVTSIRIANLDIITALRDLPQVVHHRHRLRSSGPAAVGVAVGSLLAVWGIVDVVPLAAVLGPPLALVSMLPLLRPVVGRRIATAVASVGTLVWCIGVFTFLTRITDRSRVPVFVVQGIVMVAAAVGLATALDRIWKAVLEALTRTGTGLAGRLGLAYPLDRLFRTSMLLAMYALIVFTLTFLAVYAKIFGDQAASLTRQVAAGAQLQVDSNPSDPVSAAALGRTPGVDEVATLWRSAPRFSASFHPEAAAWPVTGFDADLLHGGTPALSERAPAYATDRAVFEALLRHPNLIVVDEQFLEGTRPSTAEDRKVVVGDVVTGTNPTTGRTESFRVVGLVDRDVNETGAWASRASLQRLVGSAAVPSRAYLRVADGEDPAVVAAHLSSDLVDRGVEVRTFRTLVDDQIGIEIGFFRLIQSYLAIGLVVGIAGLAVVMVRAARERRRQIGMLRAIGFPSDTVRHAFLVEASFISLQGIATGVGLGLLVSYQMLSRTASLGGDPLPFAVPWTTIAALAVIPFAASLAVALIPASQAVSLNPAEVLRLPD